MRPVARRRIIAPVLLVILALPVLAACGSGDPSSSPSGDGCGACGPEIAALRAGIAEVEGVKKVTSVTYTEKVALTTPPTVQVMVDVDASDAAAVTDRIAELAWESEVSPLDTVSVEWRGADGIYQRPVSYRFGTDAAEYEQRWGPRPGA